MIEESINLKKLGILKEGETYKLTRIWGSNDNKTWKRIPMKTMSNEITLRNSKPYQHYKLKIEIWDKKGGEKIDQQV